MILLAALVLAAVLAFAIPCLLFGRLLAYLVTRWTGRP